MVFGGLDEAGRGPVLGPLVVGFVVASKEQISSFVDAGVKDSKKLSPKKRFDLFDFISKNSLLASSFTISASQIDSDRASDINLNSIERSLMLQALSSTSLPITTVIVDSLDIKPDRLASWFSTQLPHLSFICEHKADETFPVVSAASIIAKVTRDRFMIKLASDYGFELGSGYPSDPKTRSFLEMLFSEKKVIPPFVRQSWKTFTSLQEKHHLSQTKINDFF
ncbi:MAG: ribonuclease HII [Candidatus Kariarchaeaceae archaeon]